MTDMQITTVAPGSDIGLSDGFLEVTRIPSTMKDGVSVLVVYIPGVGRLGVVQYAQTKWHIYLEPTKNAEYQGVVITAVFAVFDQLKLRGWKQWGADAEAYWLLTIWKFQQKRDEALRSALGAMLSQIPLNNAVMIQEEAESWICTLVGEVVTAASKRGEQSGDNVPGSSSAPDIETQELVAGTDTHNFAVPTTNEEPIVETTSATSSAPQPDRNALINALQSAGVSGVSKRCSTAYLRKKADKLGVPV